MGRARARGDVTPDPPGVPARPPEVSDAPAAGRARLVSETAAAWAAVRSLLESVRDTLPEQPPANGAIAEVEANLRAAAPGLIVEPLDQYQRRKPLSRALAAIEEYAASAGERRRKVAAAHGMRQGDAFACVLIEDAASRARLDGMMQAVMCAASLHLARPWHLFRNALAAPGEFGAAVAQWRARLEELSTAADNAVRRYEIWSASAGMRLERALARPPNVAARYLDELRVRRARSSLVSNIVFWGRQQRDVLAALAVERQLALLCVESAGLTAHLAGELRQEHLDLQGLLAQSGDWLNVVAANPREAGRPFPEFRVIGVDERLNGWLERIEADGREQLPESFETVEPGPALPGVRSRWRESRPRAALIGSLRSEGAPRMQASLCAISEPHLAALHELERVRQVVSYAAEPGPAASAQTAASAQDREALREAVANSRLLLEHARLGDAVQSSIETCGTDAVLATFRESDERLERTRLGLLAWLARQQSARRAAKLRKHASLWISGRLRSARAASRARVTDALLRAGLLPPVSAKLPPVVRRANLDDVFDFERKRLALPAIYTRLFSLAPVQDSRFLIGREAEMAGIASALASWESGREAALLLVGAKGSGKTSLLNCACTDVFHGREIVRGSFRDRLTTPDGIRAFLGNLLGCEPSEIEAASGGRRRIVILEELEHAFLRKAHGFEAVRELNRVIPATARSIFWVVAINTLPFRLFNAAAGFPHLFSHRINAASMSLENLARAILERHKLSGLRVSFQPAPAQGWRRRLASAAGEPSDPQTAFFESLYRQSGGVLRSAFELWLSSIVAVEPGLIEMHQPLAPEYASLYAELTQSDHFTIIAIAQHGSLTAAELTEVLMEPQPDSAVRLVRLEGMGILEPDPDQAGMRIRPEAARIVVNALHRANLL